MTRSQAWRLLIGVFSEGFSSARSIYLLSDKQVYKCMSVLEEATPQTRTGGRRRQADRTATTRRRILRAALGLVADHGYDRASLAAIGERAGYSRGIVTACFGSKADLLASVVEDMLERWGHRSLRPAVGASVGSDALAAAIDAVKEQARNHPVELKAF